MKSNKPKNGKTVKAVYNLNPRTIQMNCNGAKITCPHHQTGKQPAFGLDGKKEGSVIKGFSKHASKRMREAFWNKKPKEGIDLYALTFTVPGDTPLTPEEERKLWDRFVILLNRALHAAGMWRREHQIRKQVHWHIILGLSGLFEGENIVDAGFVRWLCWRVWADALNVLAPSGQMMDGAKRRQLFIDSGGLVDLDKSCTEIICKRSAMVGADAYAVHCERVDSATGIYKYLMDHASKNKREQVSTFGRAWGFIRKKDLPAFFDEPEASKVELSEYQFARLHRVLRKWCRPRIKCPAAPFGCKLGWESKRGRMGSSIWFGMPEKAVEWASALVKPESSAVPVFRPSDFPARTRCLI